MFGLSAFSEVPFSTLPGAADVIAIPNPDTVGLEFRISNNLFHYTLVDEDR